MGKALLILLAALTFVGGYMVLNIKQTAYETDGEQSSYAETVVAGKIAQSAFDMGFSEVQRDFENDNGKARPKEYGIKYQGGEYDLVVEEDGTNKVAVIATGRFGKASVIKSGMLKRSLEDFLDALNLDVDEVDPNGDSKMTITGMDTPPPSEGGGVHAIGTADGPNTRAVNASVSTVRDDLLDEWDTDQVYGAAGSGDIHAEPFTTDIDNLYAEALKHTVSAVYNGDKFEEATYYGKGAHLFSGKDLEFKEVTFGSSANPAVVRVLAQKTVKFNADVTGYGVLYVRAETVEFKEGFLWEGLVLIDADYEKATVKIDKGQVFGAMVIRRNEETWEDTSDDDDKGLSGGHFDVDVFGPSRGSMKKVYHQHQYDDKFDLTYVDLFNATGCGSAGLCLEDLVLSEGYTNVRVEFFNADRSSGTYSISADGSTYTGSPDAGFTKTFDISTVSEFIIDFDDLQRMIASSPGDVQSDSENRNSAFSVRIYDVDSNEMIYELSVYEHDDECNIGQTEGCKESDADGGGDDEEDPKDDDKESKYKALKLEVKGENGGIFYSTDALIRTATLLETVAKKIQPVLFEYREQGTDLQGKFSTE